MTFKPQWSNVNRRVVGVLRGGSWWVAWKGSEVFLLVPGVLVFKLLRYSAHV